MLTLPLPARALSPNSRVHWAKKAKAVKEYRALAAGLVCAQLTASQRPRWEGASVRITWHMPDARRRDPDNNFASLKAAFDGMTDAGLIADDRCLMFALAPPLIDRANPRIEIEITGLTP